MKIKVEDCVHDDVVIESAEKDGPTDVWIQFRCVTCGAYNYAAIDPFFFTLLPMVKTGQHIVEWGYDGSWSPYLHF